MKRSENGLTLLELLAVLAVLAIIMAIAVPCYDAVVGNSRARVCEDNLEMLNHAAQVYHEVENQWPADQQALLDAGYIDHLLRCPVNNEAYLYENNRFVCSGH